MDKSTCLSVEIYLGEYADSKEKKLTEEFIKKATDMYPNISELYRMTSNILMVKLKEKRIDDEIFVNFTIKSLLRYLDNDKNYIEYNYKISEHKKYMLTKYNSNEHRIINPVPYSNGIIFFADYKPQYCSTEEFLLFDEKNFKNYEELSDLKDMIKYGYFGKILFIEVYMNNCMPYKIFTE
jgi:hypothetical protein